MAKNRLIEEIRLTDAKDFLEYIETLKWQMTDRSFDFGRSVLSGPRGPSGRGGGLVEGPQEGAIASGERRSRERRGAVHDRVPLQCLLAS